MMRRFSTLGMLIAVSLLLHAATASHGQVCLDSPRLGDRIIVRLSTGSTLESFMNDFKSRHPDIGMMPVDDIPGRPIHLVALQLPAGITDAQLDLLEIELATMYLSLDWGEMLYTSETPEGNTGSTLVDGPALSVMFENQYAMQKLGFSSLSERSAGANPIHARATGRGTVIAVLDTGIDMSHDVLASRLVPGGFDFVDNDPDPSDTADGVDSDFDGLVDEMAGHGTYVAALASLVAPEAGILPIRVLDDDGNGDLWLMAKGLFHAIDRGVEVINVSIGTTYRSSAVEEATEEAMNLGIPVVAAAGNCDRETPRTFPGMGSGALAVAALDADDVKGVFSNYGDRIFISAPGVSDGLTTLPDPDRSIISAIPGNEYALWEGTSMATPLVTGVVALVRSQHPEWHAMEATFDQLSFNLTATSVSIDAANPAYLEQLGSGRIHALSAVRASPVMPALGDLDGNGRIEALDLIRLLTDWGQTHTSADLNGDAIVNVPDLLIMLRNWG